MQPNVCLWVTSDGDYSQTALNPSLYGTEIKISKQSKPRFNRLIPMEVKPENMLSLRVGRVVSRQTQVTHFVTPQEYDRLVGTEETVDNLVLPPDLIGEWRLLPQHLANVYLGETFAFYMCCTNDSIKDSVTEIVVRIDLQVGNRAVNLGESKASVLEPKERLNDIMKHEIKEMGPHVLIFTIAFVTDSERQSYRKFFKFQVMKPLDVKTKFYNAESDEVYLEALLQNLTATPICLERVMLEPSANFDVQPMNTIITEEAGEHWVFGRLNRFNSQECRQYLFCLTPKPQIKYNCDVLRNSTEIGKLDIVWVTAIGERGHLQTSQLERMAPNYGDLKLVVEKMPARTALKSQFDVVFRLINCCSRVIDPLLHFDNSAQNQTLLWLGTSGRSLGLLDPSTSVNFKLSVYPIQRGIQCLPSIRILDSYLKNDYNFEEIAFVFVE